MYLYQKNKLESFLAWNIGFLLFWENSLISKFSDNVMCNTFKVLDKFLLFIFSKLSILFKSLTAFKRKSYKISVYILFNIGSIYKQNMGMINFMTSRRTFSLSRDFILSQIENLIQVDYHKCCLKLGIIIIFRKFTHKN
ncbi:hypothetical protein BpHYR1_031854 [Brachionus plicatilis]|uniref:Uncharacterized protein n=1 Tax=Brachionus plicatilis TaxID=10195 RepID=A0A3M7SGV9_BRAPC|nr:hypothetical protein BpHYR1_031854 [Brachionus plicatilis]